MGLLAQNSEDIELERFHVELRPDGGRYFTTQADATHFVACRGRVSLQHCRFENMMDDALNVHGVYLKVLAREGKHTLVGRFMHEQSFGFPWASPGDSVRLVTSRDIQGLEGVFHVRAISSVGGRGLEGAREVRITFDEELPADYHAERGISMENLSRTPSVVFAHNLVRHNRARGILINTPRPVLIEENTFDHVSGSAILFSTDNNMWYESGQTREVVIRRNTFQDVLTSLYQFTTAVISIHPIIPELALQRHPFYGQGAGSIRIEDNIFRTFDTPLLHAISTDGILWRGNRIEPTKTYPKYHPNQKRFLLEGCRNIDIEPKDQIE
jgi:alpha-1,3-galactosidase B